MESVTVVQAVTMAVAVLGAVLGIINTWHMIDRSRVKLRVRPAHAIPIGNVNESLTFCIEVTNLSAFPVTVRDVGVFYHGTNHRGAYAPPVLIDSGGWPRRLEPRSSVTVYGQKPDGSKEQPIKCAYAKTECGVTQTGTSPALKQIAHG